jgi:HAE1 family hydrophobic/amphiphilic exporter-1
VIRALFTRMTGFLVLAALLFAAGLFVVTRLPVMMYPQTERPRVRVSVAHPGVSAVDFQENYADYFEPHLIGLENLDTIESTYASDQSSFNLTFDWNMERDTALDSVESLLNSLNSGLPDELQDSYRVGSWQGENAGFLVMGVFSETTSPEELYSRLSRSVEPRLNGIADVEEIGFYNVEELNVDIHLRQNAMLPLGITIVDVDQALRQGVSPIPLGTLSEEGKDFSVRFRRDSRGLANLEHLAVKVIGDRTVTLGEISDISIAYELPGNLFLVDGEPVVQLTATPVDGGNITQMTRDIMAVMESARDEGLIPEDSDFSLFLDPAKYIKRAISNVVRAALIGGALAVLIVFLILGEVRNTLIIAFSLPFTIVLSFILMWAFGISLNLISLGGLALAVGMIIDSTIVVMENIHRFRIAEGRPAGKSEWREIVSAATDQVRSPVVASVLTSVLVFFPISFTAPLTNAILGDQAKTVIFSLLASLFTALFLVPVVAYGLYHPGRGGASLRAHEPEALKGFSRFSTPVMQSITAAYRRAVGFIIRRRCMSIGVILAAFGLLAASVLLILPEVPRELISPPSSDRVVVFFRNFVEYPDTQSVMEKALPDIEERIRRRVGEHVVSTYANVRGRFNMIFIDLDGTEFTEYAVGELQDEFTSTGNNYYNVMPWDPAELPLPNTVSLKISVLGPDEEIKTALLEEIRDLIDTTEIYRWVRSRPSPALAEELVLTPRDRIFPGFTGWTEASLTAVVRQVLGGTSVVNLVEGDFDVSVSARYPDEDLDSRAKLENFLVPWNNLFIPLKHFFRFSEERSVSEIYAVDGEPSFEVFGRIFGHVPERERSESEKKVAAMLKEELELPDGYSWILENPQEEMEHSIKTLFVALGISILLIYLLLSFQFNSLWLPLVILVSVPLGFIGVIISLKVFGSTVSLNSMLGTILLGGVVVNNSIILIDFWLKARMSYENQFEALEQTAAIRFQPIIITTATTILGMLPIAMGLGEGSNILQPLGIAVSGGLLISTIFTLFIVPSLLSLSIRKHQDRI